MSIPVASVWSFDMFIALLAVRCHRQSAVVLSVCQWSYTERLCWTQYHKNRLLEFHRVYKVGAVVTMMNWLDLTSARYSEIKYGEISATLRMCFLTSLAVSSSASTYFDETYHSRSVSGRHDMDHTCSHDTHDMCSQSKDWSVVLPLKTRCIFIRNKTQLNWRTVVFGGFVGFCCAESVCLL